MAIHPRWHADHPENRKKPTDESIIIEGRKYVPLDRNHLAAQMGSDQRRRKFSTDYGHATAHIEKALREDVVLRYEGKYVDILYPERAAEILQLSRTRYWPGYEVDAVLEACLTKWIKENVGDLDEYARILYEAIIELECTDGLFLRLNHDVVAQPDTSTIRVSTTQGSVEVGSGQPRRQVLMGRARQHMKVLLQREGQYASSLDVIYNGLKRIHDSHTIEQSLLSWMGYLVVRSIAENHQPVISENRLLIEQRQEDNSSPTPNSQQQG
jgi:hypothetical protein